MFKKLFNWGKKEKPSEKPEIEKEVLKPSESDEENMVENNENPIITEDSLIISEENLEKSGEIQGENLEKSIEIHDESVDNSNFSEETTSESEKEDTKEEDTKEEDTKEEETNEEETNEEETTKEEERTKEEEIKLEEEKTQPKGFFARLKEGLSKTSKNFTEKISELFDYYEGVSEQVYEDLEEILIMADVGYETTIYIVETLRKRVLDKTISDPKEVKEELQLIISEILSKESAKMNIENGPSIVTVVGVNGVGKTTTIGKLANKYKNNGKKVILAAADTFRAAASEQLDIWAKRANVEIVKQKEGADPSAVIFDGIKAAKSRGADILICDTAGRLHNKKNLMMELEKIFRIIDREYEEANKEVLLVIDATTGQNAISQAKLFKEVAPLTGIILTKLDGTAKGGVVLGIIQELALPVKYIGVGEKLDDLQEFDSKTFAKALFGQ